MRPKTVVLAVAITTLGIGACASKASPEEVERACRHQLSVATWTGYQVRLKHEGVTPASVPPEEWQRIRADAQTDIDARLASPEGQQSLAKCKKVYAQLSAGRIECILGASDAVSVNNCMPQAEKR